MTTRAPSVTLRAAVTSLEKFTWPAELIRLIRKPEVVSFSCLMKAMSFLAMLKNIEMALKEDEFVNCVEWHSMMR